MVGDRALTPRVSVVIPVRNAERWIEHCLDSLVSQNYQGFETVLIDDGCTDRTVELAQSRGLARLRVVRGPQAGLAAALALGVHVAQGDIIIRLDADDISHPDRIARQVSYLEAHPECVALGSAAQVISEDGAVVGKIHPPESDTAIRLRMTTRSPFIHPSMALRTSAVLRAGNYRSSGDVVYAEDYDLWHRLAREGLLANLPDQLVQYRITSTGVSRAHWRTIAASAQDIAADSMESWLGMALSRHERELVGMFHARSRRVSPDEALKLAAILIKARAKAGPHRLPRAMPVGDLIRPLAWVFLQPKERA